MKKVLVATCVVAVSAFGITHASATPAQTARASAFGIELSTSLLGDEPLIDRTGEAESFLPPGGAIEDEILSVGETGELVLSATGSVLADTRFESTIRPILNPENEEARGGSGEGSGLLGGDLIGGLLGEEEGGDSLVGGLVGGDGGGGGGGILSNSEGGAGTVRAQQLGGDGGGDGGSLLGGDSLLGGLLGDSEDDEEGNTDPDIQLEFANAQGYAVVENLGVANEDLEDNLLGLGLTDVAAQALADALLKVEAVQAEAVVLCEGTTPRFDTASRLVDLNNDNVSLVDELVESVSELLPNVIEVNETGTTPDGGVFVNALHITLGGDLLNEDDGTSGGETTTTLVDGVTVPDVGTNSFEAQQLGGGDGGGEDALLDIILGHAEVGGTVCAEQARPPAPPSPPAGDDRTLPVTGGGLGFLPAVLGLGLAGGAVAAGRVALRSRREHTL